jgi:hypothetical protein
VRYTLTGFTHDGGARVFAFECVGEDRVRTEYRVSADLTLVRRYGIQVQELPLLCRGLLERHQDAGEARSLTFTEEEMQQHAQDCAAARRAAAQKRKSPRRPTSENLGVAWRTQTHGPSVQ